MGEGMSTKPIRIACDCGWDDQTPGLTEDEYFTKWLTHRDQDHHPRDTFEHTLILEIV